MTLTNSFIYLKCFARETLNNLPLFLFFHSFMLLVICSFPFNNLSSLLCSHSSSFFVPFGFLVHPFATLIPSTTIFTRMTSMFSSLRWKLWISLNILCSCFFTFLFTALKSLKSANSLVLPLLSFSFCHSVNPCHLSFCVF